MSRRTVWTTVFLGFTLAAVGMEVWGANDASPDTLTWTELVTSYVPQTVALGAVATLTAWLMPHFSAAYQSRGTPAPEGGATVKTAKFWVALVGAVATAVSGYFAPDTTVGKVITAVIAVTTAVSVYLVPNAPAVTPPEPVPPMRQVTRHDGT